MMPVSDYMGIEGFAVDAKSAQDVYDAIDRIHTQIMDEQTRIKSLKRSPDILAKKSEELEQVMRILEGAMDKLLDIESVSADG